MQSAPQCPTEADASAPLPSPLRNGAAAWLLTAAWTAMGLVLWVLFPMTATVLTPLCCIAPLAWHWVARRRLPRYPLSPMTTALLLAAACLLVNATWSLSPASAAMTVAFAFVMVASLHVVLNTLPDLDPEPLRAMAAGALVGLGVAGAVLCLEIFSDQSLRRFLMRFAPVLQPSAHHIWTEGGHLARLAPYLPNASVSVLTCMFWPALLLASRLGLTGTLRICALMASAVVAATVFASEHATSQIAFVGAGAVFALFWLRPKLVMPIVIAGWVAANLLVVPAAALLYGLEAYRAPWLPESAQHRIVIWGYTSAQIHKAPLLGAGISTGRALHEALGDNARRAPGTRFRLSTGLHSHNAYLQVWYETGAVGALIMLNLGLMVLWALRSFPAQLQPYLAAAFAACALLMASAYSIWAPWFMASLAMASVFAALGTALPPPCAPHRTSG